MEDDIDLGQLLVGPYDNTVVLEELRFVPLFRVFTVYYQTRLDFGLCSPAYFVMKVVFWVDRAGTKYTVSVFGMFEGGESMPLAGEEYTTYSDAPDPPNFDKPSNITHIYVMYIAHGHCKNKRRRRARSMQKQMKRSSVTVSVVLFKSVSPVCFVSLSNIGECVTYYIFVWGKTPL